MIRRRRQRSKRVRPPLLWGAVAACFTGSAYPLPTAPAVVSGQAALSIQGRTLTVSNSPGSIIQWGGFSIQADELVRFLQPSAASAVLNRVVGQDPSRILGQLQSNGRVYLLNPNGIAFGPGAQIDVAGLVASTLHLSDTDFLSGRLRFTEQGSAGPVTHQGRITTPAGGQVFLVAPRVENSGLINTPGGDITLAAGRTVEIVDPTHPAVRIEVSTPENAVLNLGRLIAAGGRVSLAGSLLRMSGRVSADAAVIENGKITLRRTALPTPEEVAGQVRLQASESLAVEPGARLSADGPVAGVVELQSAGSLALQPASSVSASGAAGGRVSARAVAGSLIAEGLVEALGGDGPGGRIQLQGERVALSSTSRTDASGTRGGGTVLVGGGFQGADPATQHASRTAILPGAVIAADATRAGNGGQVVVWSDTFTRFRGAITARGAGVGHGGSVEVSGKAVLDFAGGVDVSAASGRAGSVLLDPANINLTTSAANTSGFNVPANDLVEAFTDDGTGTSNFNVNPGGSFAGIASGSRITLQATNNISVLSPFNVTTATGGNTGVSVTLQANNAIAINAAVTTAGTGNITLIADNDGNGVGAISRTSAGTLNTGAGGSVTLSAGSGLNAAVSSPSVIVSNANGGVVTVTNANAGGAVSLGNVAASGLTVTTSNGAITQTGATNVSTGTAAFNAGTAGDITLDSRANDFGTATFTSARHVTVADANALVLGASTLTGNLTVSTANAAITQTGALIVPGTANFRAGTGNVTLATATNNFNVVDLSAQGASLRDANTVTLGNVATTGSLTLVTAGALNQSAGGALAVGGVASLTAGAANNISLSNPLNNFTTVRIVSGNYAQLRDIDSLEIGGGASSVTRTLTLNTGGTLGFTSAVTAGNLSVTTSNAGVTQSAPLTVAGTSNFATGTGDILLGNASNNFGTVTVTSAGNATLVDANAITVGASTLGGNLSVKATNSTLTVAGNVSTASAGGAITFNAGTGTYAQNANIDVAAGAGNLTIEADLLTLSANSGNNALRTSGTLTLRPSTITRAMTVAGGGGGFALTAGALDAFMLGVNTAGGAVVIGRPDSTAALTLRAAYNFGVGSKVTLAAGSIGDANTTNRVITATELALYASSGNIGGPGNNAIDVVAANLNLSSANQSAFVTSTGSVNFGFGSSNLGTGNLTVSAVGDITQSTGTAILTGGTASFTSGGANRVALTSIGNDFGTVSLTAGSASLVDANKVNIGASSVAGNLAVTTTGSLDFSGAVSASNLSVTTNGGALTQSAALAVATGTATLDAGSGSITLANPSNDFGTVAATGDAITLRDTNAVVLGPTRAASTLSVTAGNAITQSGAIVTGGAAAFDTTAAAALGNVVISSSGSLALGNSTVGGSATLTGTGGTVTLPAGTTLTVAGDLALSAGSAVGLAGTLRVGSAQRQTDASGTTIAATGIGPDFDLSTAGLPGSGNVTVNLTTAVTTFNAPPRSGTAVLLNDFGNNFGGAVSVATAAPAVMSGPNLASYNLVQSAAAYLSGRVLTVRNGGDVTLNRADNRFGLLRLVGVANASVASAGSLTIADSTASGSIVAQAGGDITLAGVLEAAGTGNAIVLATGGSFINTAGATALRASAGRWLVYSTDPALNDFAGLASVQGGLWSHSYASNPPASILQPGNRYLFTTGRTLLVSPSDLVKAFGDDASAALGSAWAVAGLSAATYGGALTVDTQAGILSGAPVVSSLGASPGAEVAGSPYAINLSLGALAAANGYALAAGPAARLTVAPAPLVIGVADVSRMAGRPNPVFTPTFAGFRLGQGPGVLLGSLQFETLADVNVPPGAYAVTPFGVSAANYAISFSHGTLRVTPRFTDDPLQGARRALLGPVEAGQFDFRAAGSASRPMVMAADAAYSFDALVRDMPATATGPAPRAAEPLEPACASGLPFSALRCRRAEK